MEQFRITTEQAELDLALIHHFLSQKTGWAKGIPFALIQNSIEHSLCFAGFIGNTQTAFARVISDYATFANLVDVFDLLEQRGNGYG